MLVHLKMETISFEVKNCKKSHKIALIFPYFKMSFMNFELEGLAKAFPTEKASLENDFDTEELEAIDNVGVLRGNPHIYLGKIIILILTKFSKFNI